MRIISQDGEWDLPYDRIAVNKLGNKIFAKGNLISGGDDNYVELANYSRSEKTNMAMKLLHDTYRSTEKAKAFGRSISYPINSIFQFPQDSQIEV